MSQYFDFLKSNPAIQKLLLSLAAIIIVLFIRFFINISFVRKIDSSEVQYRTKKWIGNISYIIYFLLILAIFSNQLEGLAVFIGAISVGIAITLQEVILSIAGWIAVTVGKFYRPGDRVQLGGIKGDVIDINLLRTTVMEIGEWIDADLPTGRTVRITNSFVFKEPVFNYTIGFPFLWDEIKIPVQHTSDYILTRKILEESVKEICAPIINEASKSWKQMTNSYFLNDMKMDPNITMKVTDNWIEFSIRYIVNYKERGKTKDLIFSKILQEINKYPDKVFIASATFAIVEMPSMSININKEKETV